MLVAVQLWIASPLPFMLNFAIISATDARAVHLAFALFLAFMAYPAEKSPFQLALGVSVPVILSGLFIYGAPAAMPLWWLALAGAGVVAAVLLGSPRPAFRHGNGCWRWPAWSSPCTSLSTATRLAAGSARRSPLT